MKKSDVGYICVTIVALSTMMFCLKLAKIKTIEKCSIEAAKHGCKFSANL